MNRFKLTLLVVALAALVGCWKQHDEITIKSDGSIAFQTEVTVTDPGFSRRDIEGLSNDFSAYLRRAGWKVEKSWIAQGKPFRLAFRGEANLKTLRPEPDFYTLKKLDEHSFRMTFIPAQSKAGRSTRSIHFNLPLFGGAKVWDNHGQPVQDIPNVDGRNAYLVTLS